MSAGFADGSRMLSYKRSIGRAAHSIQVLPRHAIGNNGNQIGAIAKCLFSNLPLLLRTLARDGCGWRRRQSHIGTAVSGSIVTFGTEVVFTAIAGTESKGCMGHIRLFSVTFGAGRHLNTCLEDGQNVYVLSENGFVLGMGYGGCHHGNTPPHT